MKHICKNISGITLVSLVVTIIVLIILAGVSVNIVVGENGLIEKAKQTKMDYEITMYVEEIEVIAKEVQAEKGGKATITDLVTKILNDGIISGGTIQEVDSQTAEAITKEGYILTVTFDKTTYNGKTSKPQVSENIIINQVIWDSTTHTASTTISKSDDMESTLELQYQIVTNLDNVVEENWVTGTNVTGLKHNDYLCVRLWDGSIEQEFTNIQVKDKLDPSVTVDIIATGDDHITVNATAIDNEYGMLEEPSYTYYIKESGQSDSSYTKVDTQKEEFVNTQNNTTYSFVQDGTKWIANNINQEDSSAWSEWTITVSEDTTYAITYKVISEDGSDFMLVELDGDSIIDASGVNEEKTCVIELTKGSHTIYACYEKDDSVTVDKECAYIILEPINRIGGLIANTEYVVMAKTSDLAGNEGKGTVKVKTGYPKLVKVAKPGDYVKYTPTAKTFSMTSTQTGQDSSQSFNTASYTGLWRVLYNDDTYGLRIVAEESVEELTLGHESSQTKTKTAYNNAITTLHSFCQNYINTSYATGARCLGSNPLYPLKDTTSTVTLPFKYNGSTASGFKQSDTNANTDAVAMNNINLSYGSTWFASRYYEFYDDDTWGVFGIRIANTTENELWYVDSSGNSTTYEVSAGVKPVITLDSKITTNNGDGSEGNAYQLVPVR